MMVRNTIYKAALFAALAVLLTSCGLRRHKYDNRITKDTQQPDKVLFDAAIDDIEHSRFERARLTLQTLMNTYDTSEYLAKAKLAIADSWFREGGGHGMAQAEAEYKDFILFYPQMEEAAEAQEKICKMQYQQMEKADRDSIHALRAEDECRQLLTQFPNSKFAPNAQQMLRDIQEVLGEKEYRVGQIYLHKGSFYAAANRMQGVADQFPIYSKADEALWDLGSAYTRLGDRFENQQASAYTRIVKDYPLSVHVEEAKARLKEMNRPIPEADPVAYARMKYEIENRSSRSLLGKAWGPFSGKPDMTGAAKSGTPQMTGFRPTIPLSVPASAGGGATGVNEVGVTVPTDNVLDKNPDARANPPAAGTPAPAAAGTAPPATGAPTTPPAADAPTTTPATPATTPDATAAPATNTQTPPATQNGKPKKAPKAKKPSKKSAKQVQKEQQQQQQQPQPAVKQ